MNREFVIWVFVGCDPVGFYWLLCFGGFLLVMGVRFVGLVVLDGIAVGLWVSLSVWSWAMGCGCGARFFLLGLLGSDGGLVPGYSGGSVVGCACVVGCRLICGAGLVVLWVVVW